MGVVTSMRWALLCSCAGSGADDMLGVVSSTCRVRGLCGARCCSGGAEDDEL